jgi:V8-like Glu-specific endopeptidase
MSFFHRTLALLLAVTSFVTALPTSNTPRENVPIQGIGQTTPPPFDPSAPKPTFLQVSKEELAAAIANVTAGRHAPGPSPLTGGKRSPSLPVSERGVIGADNRVYWPSTDYPYSAMGRLLRSDGKVCTGALIGPRHVTTAKHCVSDGSVTIKFQPAYNGGDRFPSANVQQVLVPGAGATDQCNYKDDWAVVLLDARLGDARGYLSYDVMDPAKADQAIFYSYGYPDDKSADLSKPYRQEAITVAKKSSFQCDQYGPLTTNADANGGQSGSPLWLPPDANGNRVTYGVMASSSATATYFAGGEVWAGGIQYMLSSYP